MFDRNIKEIGATLCVYPIVVAHLRQDRNNRNEQTDKYHIEFIDHNP